MARITVYNTGGSTAAQVEIGGELVVSGDVERSQVTLDYVPDGSLKRAGLIFHGDPGNGTLNVRPVGYRET